MPRRRAFWVALLLFLTLFFWIRFYELPRHRAGSAASPDSLFLSVPALRIRAFTVAFEGDTTRVAREGPDWWVVAPVRYPADPVAVQAFLSRCENAPVSRTFAFRTEEASRYGLDQPSCIATLEESDGRITRLIMGAPAPATPAFYVRVEGRDVVGLFGQNDADNFFRRRTEDWRLRRLLAFAPEKVVRLELAWRGRAIRLARGGPQAAWRVVEPFPGLASASFVASYLKGLSFTAALSFQAESTAAPAAFGLDPPEGWVEVTEEGGRHVALFLGSDLVGAVGPRQVYARVSGRAPLYGAPAGYRELVAKSDLEFRDRSLLRRALHQYRSFEFSASDARLVLTPDSAGIWHDSRESGKPHPSDRTDLVTAWVSAGADSIVPNAPQSLAGTAPRPSLDLVATGVDTQVERLVVGAARVGPGGREFWPVRMTAGELNRSDEVFLVSGDVVRPILALLAR